MKYNCGRRALPQIIFQGKELELEDVAEKARRNLLMVSGGIVAVWALGIPLDGKLVGAVDLSSVEPWRAWAAASAVLLYFSLRHYFAPATHKAWRGWTTRRNVWFVNARHRLLEDCVPSGKIAEREQSPFNDERIALKIDGIPAEGSWISFRNQAHFWDGRKGSMDILWYRHTPGLKAVPFAKEAADLRTKVQFSIGLRSYILLMLKSWLQAYKFSWSLLELSFPWALASWAAIVCICKLAASIYYSFPFVRQLLPA